MPARRNTPFYERQSGEIPLPRNARGRVKFQRAGMPMTYEQWKEANKMTDVNPSTQPLAVPHDGYFPAGHPSPAEHEAAERRIHALEIAHEAEAQAKADREAEIDRRMAAARGGSATEAE